MNTLPRQIKEKYYEEIEDGLCEAYKFSHPLGSFSHLFIKRQMPTLVDGEKYYDIVTSYCYKGHLITCSSEQDKAELVHAFKEDFQQYCDANRNIAEFVRFHPVLRNAEHFKEYYEIEFCEKQQGLF